MSERTSTPSDTHKPTSDHAIEATLEAKIEGAINRGLDLDALATGTADDHAAFIDQLGFTHDEKVYMASKAVRRIVQVCIGQKVIETLDEHCRVAREDLIPSIQAYFEAVNSGEIEDLGRVSTQQA